jgi:hypothetical protein
MPHIMVIFTEISSRPVISIIFEELLWRKVMKFSTFIITSIYGTRFSMIDTIMINWQQVNYFFEPFLRIVWLVWIGISFTLRTAANNGNSTALKYMPIIKATDMTMWTFHNTPIENAHLFYDASTKQTGVRFIFYHACLHQAETL